MLQSVSSLITLELPRHHVKSNEVFSVIELVFRCGRRLAGIRLSLSKPRPSWRRLLNRVSERSPVDARWDLQHTAQAYSSIQLTCGEFSGRFSLRAADRP